MSFHVQEGTCDPSLHRPAPCYRPLSSLLPAILCDIYLPQQLAKCERALDNKPNHCPSVKINMHRIFHNFSNVLLQLLQWVYKQYENSVYPD